MTRVYQLDGEWLVATDPANEGKGRGYESRTAPDARPARVPGAIEETFPGYDGVVWYWRVFAPPLAEEGRPWAALRIGAADYYAEVWLNGRHLGSHEGGETPFVLPLGGALGSSRENLLAVRLVHVGKKPIDGFVFEEIPHGIKNVLFRPGRFHNYGGIWQSVDLLAQPAARVADVFSEPRLRSGEVVAHVTLANDGAETVAELEVSVAGRDHEGIVAGDRRSIQLPRGISTLQLTLRVPQHREWSLDLPNLYRLTVRLATGARVDERSVRFGFREFTFRDGYFWLNDTRLLLKGTHTVGHYPIGQVLPPGGARSPELLRQELVNLKLMGLNCCRSLGRLMFPEQLDVCDELGLMVYQETLAAWQWRPSPAMPARFDAHVAEMIRRDRNHPSVTIWGLLNEMQDPTIFQHAVGMLPLVRSLDPTRLVLLNSGRFEATNLMNEGERSDIGACALPYQSTWSPGFADYHRYVPRPLEEEPIHRFRTFGAPDHRLFQSEYGNGSAIDPVQLCRLFEQAGALADHEDYLLYRRLADLLEVEFRHFGLDEVFATPSDLVRASEELQAENRAYAIGLMRSNPNLCGYSITGMLDHTMVGEGLMTLFRRPKQGTIDGLREAWQSLKFSVVLDRTSIYQGEAVRIEGVLSNEDALASGTYPAWLRVFGPAGMLLERSAELTIPAAANGVRPGMVFPIFDERVAIAGPPGRYEVRVDLARGGAALGRAHVDVSEPLASASGTVALWDADERLGSCLRARGIEVVAVDGADFGPLDRPVLVNAPMTRPGVAAELGPLLDWIERGGTAVFLSPRAFGLNEQWTYGVGVHYTGELANCPFGQNVSIRQARGLWWAVDQVVKDRPMLAGLPTRSLMDLHFYRQVYPRWNYLGLADGDVAIAGVGIGTCCQELNYWMGADLTTIAHGRGRAVLSTLLVAENAGRDPAADRLLLNLVTYAVT